MQIWLTVPALISKGHFPTGSNLDFFQGVPHKKPEDREDEAEEEEEAAE